MSLRTLLMIGTLLAPVTIFAQAPEDAFQLRYVSNLNLSDAYINITNNGQISGTDPAGNVCVNIYTFRPDQEPVNCCSCLTTPDGLYSIDVNAQLNVNPLLNEAQNALVIKLINTLPVGGVCNPANLGAAAGGIRAWATSVHRISTNNTGTAYGLTETEFARSYPSVSEITKLVGNCSFIQTNGTGTGVCRGCSIPGGTTPGGLVTSIN